MFWYGKWEISKKSGKVVLLNNGITVVFKLSNMIHLGLKRMFRSTNTIIKK